MDARRAVLGDWHPFLRDPLDVLRLAFVGAAVVYVVWDRASVVNLAVSSAAVVAVRFVDLPRLYDLGFVLAMALTGWGDALGLYDRFGDYDRVVHFLVPLVIAPVVYILLARAYVLPDLRDAGERRHHLGVFVVTLAFGAAIGALWEVFEWCSDHLLGSHLQHGQTDTIGDLVADTCGALVGGVLLVAWSIYGWGSERRRPGPAT
ncbi:MAG TPA: DUF2238 domain-containing protein [Gaiellaceae bacterium]|jgi:hypothetical protein